MPSEQTSAMPITLKLKTTTSLNCAATLWSMAEMSAENRLSTRPSGVASNHAMGARITARIIPPWSLRDAATDAYGSTTLRIPVMPMRPSAASV